MRFQTGSLYEITAGPETGNRGYVTSNYYRAEDVDFATILVQVALVRIAEKRSFNCFGDISERWAATGRFVTVPADSLKIAEMPP